MKRLVWAMGLAGALAFGGCVSSRTTNTKRTAVEQLLLSTAADRAAAGMCANDLKGKKAYLDVSNLEGTDKGYVVVAVSKELGANGVLVVADEEKAEVILELGAGALATDSSDFLLGIPSFDIPLPTTISALKSPEMPLFKKISQTGRAKLLLSARDAKDGKPLLASGPHTSSAYYNRWQILFISWRTTDIPGL